LVAVREREACAKICDDISLGIDNDWNRRIGVKDCMVDVATDCADAIRSRT
jgi:hypothetical protein